MKTFLRFFPLLLLLLFSFNVRADNDNPSPPSPDKEAYGWVVPIQREIEDPEIPPIIIKRTPTSRLPMTITSVGVFIPGVNSRDIILYEILDLEETPVGIFTDGPTFAQTLFSLSGEYQVRFHTDSYIYIGYVEL